MNQQLPSSGQPNLPRTYSEDEQRRRWVLIIDAILSDPGPDERQEHWVTAPLAAPQPKQTL